MLKRLELIGFKSFADRTVFDFAAGITAVVGPNGSGKSNVVDAVKWVLGEQSAKSLRGGEMADVIFNGSTARRGLPFAEVSLTFDNAKKQLGQDFAEVRITRRVDREGQGEYFINGQVCRLKDIKDLFLGTGAGAGAYSIIEQGRVDALLQASQDDRRNIFEEAAGISRFKVKKTESLRRLERVGQNLSRLQDILAEVDQQLKSVRNQAGKATKYQEYSTRLRELRLGLGLREYHDLQARLSAAETNATSLRAELDSANNQSGELIEALKHAETALADAEAAWREQDRVCTETQTRLAALKAGLERDRSIGTQLAQSIQQEQTRHGDMTQRLTSFQKAIAQSDHDRKQAETQLGQHATEITNVSTRLDDVLEALAWTIQERESIQEKHLEALQSAARWQNEAVASAAHLDQLRRDRDRLQSRTSHASQSLANLDVELSRLLQAEQEAVSRTEALRRDLADLRMERDGLQQDVERSKQTIARSRAETAALRGRIDALEALESGEANTNDGIRDVLQLIRDTNQSHLLTRVIVGWLPDCLRVGRDDAPLIDIALGQLAEAFLVRDSVALDAALKAHPQFAGRVDFIPLDRLANFNHTVHNEVPSADQLVHCVRDDLADLPRQLLGNTFLVDDLAAARELAASRSEARFITRNGELLEPDGTLTVGLLDAQTGVLSRRSELRELRESAGELALRTAGADAELSRLVDLVRTLDAQIAGIRQEIGIAEDQSADFRGRIDRHRDKQSGLHGQVQGTHSELASLTAEMDTLEGRWADADRQTEECEQRANVLRSHLEDAERSIGKLENQKAQYEQQLAGLNIELARCTERRDGIAARHEQAFRDQAALQSEIESIGRRLEDLEVQRVTHQENLLTGETALAEYETARQQALAGAAESKQRCEETRKTWRDLQATMQSLQNAWQQRQAEVHARELEVNNLRHRRDTLVQRLAEELQIDLPAEYAKIAPEELNVTPPAAQENQEADDLRKKLQKLGPVNLDALEELNQIEHKAGHLHHQFEDLTHARKTLEEIIQRINTDSKRLFQETLVTVREHFQDLFRRLFGGGIADIILADPDNPLDSAIEILARPPGKELRSISLMSGGERTMTAVALLLAIFRSKPSPFCLLDEVDAALDEANTARLTMVLREFANTSQFIVITHAKRTMAAADVLYGVTMQESGISKRVAVRFEDWPDEERKAA